MVHEGPEQDETVVIDENAMGIPRIVFNTLFRRTPSLYHVAGLIEFDDRRRWCAAGAERRFLDEAQLLFGQRFRKVRHPDVIAFVDKYSGDRTENPLVRHVVRPRRIDAK